MYKNFKEENMSSPRNRNEKSISFSINGKVHEVGADYPSRTSLNEYIRDVAGLKGTKVMCREAGCGACAVTVSSVDLSTNKIATKSVCSCLVPLYTVYGWQVTTVEGLGNQKNGFHPIQTILAQTNASQCGYCTPGIVMSLYGKLASSPDGSSSQDLEDALDGNLCRCTGYRPVLEAARSFAKDNKKGSCLDIEDLNIDLCPKTGEACKCQPTGDATPQAGGEIGILTIDLPDVKWIRPSTLEELGKSLKDNKQKRLSMILGNTAAGIFKDTPLPEIFVDIQNIPDLFQYTRTDDSFTVGAGHSISFLIEKLQENKDKPGFTWFSAAVEHMKLVGNLLLRNMASIGGNLMIKHVHQGFPSDVFVMLETVGARVGIFDSESNKHSEISLMEFLSQDMKGKVLIKIILNSETVGTFTKSYKIAPRSQNAHAYINAGFRFTLSGPEIKGRPSIVYGGINETLQHAQLTEAFLTGKQLNQSTLKEAFKTLENELVTTEEVIGTAKYRKELALNLFYKYLLCIYPAKDTTAASGGLDLERPLSFGTQTFSSDPREFPLKQPVISITANVQASGEAKFTNDVASLKGEVAVAFVVSTVACAEIESIDPTAALTMPGVIKFVSAKDIPGENNYKQAFVYPMEKQELFATKQIGYWGQSIAAIVAETQAQANVAAKAVKVTYKNIKDPVVDIKDAIAKNSMHQVGYEKKMIIGDAEKALSNSTHIFEGECSMGKQYHFYIENQVALAVPAEESIDLYSATQYPDMNQGVAAALLGKPMNFINLIVPKLGGGFGGKIVESSNVSGVAALAAYILNRPVRHEMDLATNMGISGKRFPMYCKYKVGVDSVGKLQAIVLDYYIDCGIEKSFHVGVEHTFGCIAQAYNCPNWLMRGYPMKTNSATNTAMRTPGPVPSGLIIESIMERVAHELNIHPVQLKEINLYKQGETDFRGHLLNYCSLDRMWKEIKEKAEVDKRLMEIEEYNKRNMWKKRALTMQGTKYGLGHFGQGFTSNVTIYARDGSVAVSHGGVDIGQGVNTKVAQAVAYFLQVPLESVKVKACQNIIAPNNIASAASVCSEQAVQSAVEAAKILQKRIQPVREENPDASWTAILKKCIDNKIDLSAKASYAGPPGNPACNYFSYGVGAAEVELDLLTGQYLIHRVDIMFDVGSSSNALLDIGQIEGAFVMSLGAYLHEDVIHDGKDGRVLNPGTWEYKPPTTKDIPIDWRVYMLENSQNPAVMYTSRATGDPTIGMGMTVAQALRQAAQTARRQMAGKSDFIEIHTPFTVEKIQQSCSFNSKNYIF